MANIDIYWIDVNRFDTKPDKSTWLEMGHALAQRGFYVSIVTSFEEDPFSSPHYDVRFVNLPVPRTASLFKFIFLVKALSTLSNIADKQATIIVSPSALLLAPFLRSLGFKNIHLDIRTIPVKIVGLKRRIEKFLFWDLSLRYFSQFASSYSFITERLRLAAEDSANRRFPNFCIWSSGVSTTFFRGPAADDALRARTSGFRLFYHGTVMKDRGVKNLVRAVELVDDIDDISLTVIGSGPDYSEIENYADDSPLRHRFQFVGFKPYCEIPAWIANSDCCVSPLPDRPEWQVSSPLKLLEYMAMEKPIIATAIDAHKDVLRGEGFVVWADSDSPQNLASAIRQAYTNRMSLYAAAGNGPKLVKSQFEWSLLAETLGNFLIKQYGIRI